MLTKLVVLVLVEFDMLDNLNIEKVNMNNYFAVSCKQNNRMGTLVDNLVVVAAADNLAVDILVADNLVDIPVVDNFVRSFVADSMD